MNLARLQTAILAAVVLIISGCVDQSSDDQGQTPKPAATTAPQSTGSLFGKGGFINVGVATDQPGWGLFEPGSNRRSGFDIDLTGWLSSRLDFTPDYSELKLDQRVDALKKGQVQMVVEVFSITDERRQDVTFVGPYMATRQGVMVKSDDNAIQRQSDLEGKTVCTASGTTSLEQLRRMGARKVDVEPGLQGCVDRLNKGLDDAVSTDQIVLSGFSAADPKKKLRVIPDLTFGNQELYGIGLRKGDVANCNILRNELATFINEGEWTKFFQQRFPDLPFDQYKPDPTDLDPC